MLLVSLFLWIAGALCGDGCESTFLNLSPLCGWGARAVALFAYAVAALLLNGVYLFERRVSWLVSLFMWLTAVVSPLQSDCAVALSLLPFILSVRCLFACILDKGQEREVFGAFAMLSFSSLLVVQFAFLLPLFVAFLFISRVTGVRVLVSAVLGVLAPCWLLAGAVFVCPSLDILWLPAQLSWRSLAEFPGVQFLLFFYVVMAMELLVWVVATYVYVSSFYPARPLLRRRLLFFILLNGYLMLLSFALPHNYLLFLAWRLPGVAVMASYIFSMKITRLSNAYFVLLNIVWLLIAFVCLWNG